MSVHVQCRTHTYTQTHTYTHIHTHTYTHIQTHTHTVTSIKVGLKTINKKKISNCKAS